MLAGNDLIYCNGLAIQQMLSIGVLLNDVKEVLTDPQNTVVEILEPGPGTGNDRVTICGSTSDQRYLNVSIICYVQPFKLGILYVSIQC
jgi:hypothetical protein